MKNNALFPALLLLASAVLPATGSAQTAEELGASKRSSFDAAAIQRDPFLPIGYTRQAADGLPSASNVALPPPTESFIRPEAFVVTSIAVDQLPLAVINGKTYGEGDTIPFNAGGQPIKLQVYAIRDGGVVLRYNEFKVKCPIRIWQKTETPAK